MTSVQTRMFISLMRVSGVRWWLGRSSRRGRRADPHGGGITQLTQRPPAGVVVTATNAGGSPAGWMSSREGESGTVIYYLHGGAYTFGDMLTYRDVLATLVRKTHARALWLDYRLAPECPFPAAVDDALAGYRWLLDQGIPPQRIIFMGDSAGGGLAVSTMLAARDAGEPLPAGAVLFSPWTDLTGQSVSAITRAHLDPMINGAGVATAGKRYLGEADPRHPLASPLFADLHDLPPLLIEVGDAEALLDDSRKFTERARTAGVDVTLEVWAGMFHVFPIFPSLLPEARQALADVADFVARRAGQPQLK